MKTSPVAGVMQTKESAVEHRTLTPELLESGSSEIAWQLLFNNSPVAQVLQMPRSTITLVNNKFIEMSGYAREELIGTTTRDLQLRVNDVLSQQFVAAIEADGRVDGLAVNLRCKDGAHRCVLISSCPLMLDGGLQFLHTMIDITAQRNAEELARVSQAAIGAISQGVLITGPDRLILSINRAFEAMTGYTQQDMMGKTCAALQGSLTDTATVQQLREALRSKQPFIGELLNYRKDGSTFWNELSVNPVFDRAGKLTHFVGIQRDITGHKNTQEQLKLAAQVFAQGREGILVADRQGNIIMVNQAFTDISGYSLSEILGKNPSLLSSGRQDDKFYAAMWESIHTHGLWQGEVWNRRKNGTEYPEWLVISATHDRQGRVCNYIGTFSDLSLQQAARERINWLSHFDVLTGLPNRTLLDDRCGNHISTALREGKPLAMMVIGINRFKAINATQGHAIGDQILKRFAELVTQTLRDQDTVARVGGDEFALILPGNTPDGAAHLARKLNHILAEPFVFGPVEINLTASIGIAMYPHDGQNFDTLFTSAAIAMHQAKERDNGEHSFFNATMFEDTMAQAAMATGLRTAIAQNQLQLHYQPFVDLQTGHIGGMEGLLRWNHPELGAVSPARFIPVAEKTGQIVDIGAWVIRRACQDIQDWRRRGTNVPPVSVNVSPVQFRDVGLLTHLENTLQEFGIEPEMLCIEVTEGALMDNVKHSESLLHAMKAMGLKLALDDFGTGYSSLSYLKLFPFDKVKIDQSFVRDISNSQQDAVIAKVVITMAHGLGLRVIAEGVETEVQCEFMRCNVCDEIQGYFFSRPVPKDQMQAMLDARQHLPAHLLLSSK